MEWTTLYPKFGQEYALKRFRKLAATFDKNSPNVADLRPLRAKFSHIDDNSARAAGLLLCDLYEQGHAVRINRGTPQFANSVSTSGGGADSIKMRLITAR